MKYLTAKSLAAPKLNVLGIAAGALFYSVSVFAQVGATVCRGEVFGFQKSGATKVDYLQGKLPTKTLFDSKNAKGPFSRVPIEISSIQNGAYSEFIGGFINDGLSSWVGVDLDSGTLTWVARRVYDKRAPYTRPFNPYIGKQYDPNIIRSWESPDESRKEEEIIRIDPLSDQEKEAFVCLANLDWKQSIAQREPMATNTFSNFYVLVNLDPQSGHTKRIALSLSENQMRLMISSRRDRYEFWKNQ
jgi:hypothetical protein